MAKIVVLEGNSLNKGDLTWTPLNRLGSVVVFESTTAEELLDKAKDAEVIIINKILIYESTLSQLPNLKLICLTATGYNNVDVKAASKLGIEVRNVSGYGKYSVAQHVFSVLLQFTNCIPAHHASVLKGDWAKATNFSYWLSPLMELQGKTMGIYGFGDIGRQVAKIAAAFGMKVVVNTRNPAKYEEYNVEFVGLGELAQKSDVISLHASLNPENEHIINKAFLKKMKSTAYLINTSRGGLVNEVDLKEALESGQIAGAGLDVISTEPPREGNILFGVKNCILTPHMAWATIEARQRLLSETVLNIESFLEGKSRNVIKN